MESDCAECKWGIRGEQMGDPWGVREKARAVDNITQQPTVSIYKQDRLVTLRWKYDLIDFIVIDEKSLVSIRKT